MRKSRVLIWMLCSALVLPVSGADVRSQAQGAADAVKGRYGSAQGLEDGAFKPLSGEGQFQTQDGQTFEASLECPASSRFLKATIVPQGSGDIQMIGIELDRDLNGSLETSLSFTGPLAAVCSNGVQQCTPGTTSNCQGRRWRSTGSSVSLENVPVSELGGCYCINNSCGASLLLQNSRKVLTDIGTGIANVLATTNPRLSVGSARSVDTTTMEFMGQEAGCGADGNPEQYHGNTAAMEAAGQAESAHPDSTYQMLVNSPASQESAVESASCQVNRVVQLHAVDVAESAAYTVSGAVLVGSCGPRCYRYRLGQLGDNYWSGSCRRFTEAASIQVIRPELIQAARIVEVGFDDHLHVRVGGNTGFAQPSGWDGVAPQCGDPKQNFRFTGLNGDVSGSLRSVAPNTVVPWVNTTYVSGNGEGWSVLDIVLTQDCAIQSETINNGCATLESRGDCSLRNATRDGVTTHENFSATGLTPLPSTRTLSGPGCSFTLTREWWQEQRDYTCSSGSAHDLSYANQRHQSVRNSFNTETGAFTDSRMGEGGAWSQHGMTATLPPPDPAGCIRMCRTRKTAAGPAMGSQGSVSNQNNTGPANDFTYRECSAADVCPLEAGETMVAPCDCSSNFMEAVTMMQTIRMTAQDFVCEAQ